MFGFFRAVAVVMVAGLAMRGLEVTVREIVRDEMDNDTTK